MTEIAEQVPGLCTFSSESYARRLRQRKQAERHFQLYGIGAIGIAFLMLVVLLGSIIWQGYSAFWQSEIRLEIDFNPAALGLSEKPDAAELATANYAALTKAALQALFPEITDRQQKRKLNDILSTGSPFKLEAMVRDHPELIGTRQTLWLTADDDIDQLIKGHIRADSPESERRVNDVQVNAIKRLKDAGAVRQAFNSTLFTAGDSREPEQAGIWGSIVGSVLTLIVTMSLTIPVGIAAAIYLEEFAPRNRWTTLIEVNINNLAAVPSIVFGLLGLAVLLNFFGMPRSAPLVGGVVLALMTLPIIIIASRAALKAVPPSIREAALGIGASPLQVVLDHVLPLAMPGIMTGTIIGMAHALGETAPLLMVGMVAFVVDVPNGFTSSATVLPVQIYMWADSAERAFVERTSAAILILLGFLVLMNAAAVLLRRKFERRW